MGKVGVYLVTLIPEVNVVSLIKLSFERKFDGAAQIRTGVHGSQSHEDNLATLLPLSFLHMLFLHILLLVGDGVSLHKY